jgi:hypothetical protein
MVQSFKNNVAYNESFIKINNYLLNFFNRTNYCKTELIKKYVSVKGKNKNLLEAVQEIIRFEQEVYKNLMHALETDPKIKSEFVRDGFIENEPHIRRFLEIYGITEE